MKDYLSDYLIECLIEEIDKSLIDYENRINALKQLNHIFSEELKSRGDN